MEQTTALLIVIGIIAIGFIFFLILREFWCWYWKINRVIILLENIERNTFISNQQTYQANNNEIKTENKTIF